MNINNQTFCFAGWRALLLPWEHQGCPRLQGGSVDVQWTSVRGNCMGSSPSKLAFIHAVLLCPPDDYLSDSFVPVPSQEPEWSFSQGGKVPSGALKES